MTRFCRESELGPEIQCKGCDEYWPADKEFFPFCNGRPRAHCKACVKERTVLKETRLAEVLDLAESCA